MTGPNPMNKMAPNQAGMAATQLQPKSMVEKDASKPDNLGPNGPPRLSQQPPRLENPTLTTLLNHPPQSMNNQRFSPLQAQLARNQSPASASGGNNLQQQQQQQQQPRPTMMQPMNAQKIWEGELIWTETSKEANNQTRKQEHKVQCSVFPAKDSLNPSDVRADTWPRTLRMQLLQKAIVHAIGGQFFKNSTSVLFHPTPGESLAKLTQSLSSGFTGCVVS